MTEVALDGEYIPSDEHIPDSLSVGRPNNGKKRFIIVPSDRLYRTFLGSADGTGGPEFTSAGQFPKRVSVRGWKVEGSLKCGNRRIDRQGFSGLLFAYDFGKPEPN